MQRHQFIILTLISTFIFNLLIHLPIVGNIKTNGLITSSKYSIKYLELFFVSTNFEMNISSILTSQVFTGFFVAPQNFSFTTLSH